MKKTSLLLFFCAFISLSASAQDETCYTPWEMELVKEVNQYRAKNGLSAFGYSPDLTKASISNLQKNEYKTARESMGYTGGSVPLTYGFGFDYTTAAAALQTFLEIPEHKTYLEDKGAYGLYKSMGIARIGNKVIVMLGTKEETPQDFPTCASAPAANSKSYEWIFEPQGEFWEMAPYHKGQYIAVRNINQWGICNLKGEMVLDFDYWDMSPYRTEGQFVVKKKEEDKQEYIIDTRGEIIETFAYDGYIFLGKYRIAYEGDYNFLVDENGQRISEKYNDMYGIDSNRLAFLGKNNLYGIMDYTGKILVQPKFGEIMAYSENLAAVKVGTKWGFIDKAFNMAIAPMVTQKQDFYFSNGLVPVKVNGKIGYIDTKGKTVIAARYSQGDAFGENGMAPVVLNGKFGMINKKGETVMPFEYGHMLPFSHGYAAARKTVNGELLYAIINNKGKIVTGFEFNRLYFMPGGIIKACAGGRWGLLKMKN